MEVNMFLRQRPAANRLWRPQDFDLIPADELDVRGKFVVPRITRTGAGASLVAVRNEHAPEIRQRFVPPRIYCAVTALAHFSGRKCEIEFIDPLSVETTSRFGSHVCQAAADFHCANRVRSFTGASREGWCAGNA